MFEKYDIIDYDNINITFRFDNNMSKIITVNETDFMNYEPCFDYYFDKHNNLTRINTSNKYKTIYINGNEYTKCYQYDKYSTKYPNSGNGRLYNYLLDNYQKLFIN